MHVSPSDMVLAQTSGTRTSLQAWLYLQIATYESLMDVCDCIVNNWTREKPDSFLDNEEHSKP